MRTLLQTALGISLILALYSTNPLFGQNPVCEIHGDRIVCSLSANAPEIIGPIEVPNSSKVYIKVTSKSPFDECSLGEIKLTDIKEPDAIATMLQLLAKAAGFSIPSGGAAFNSASVMTLAPSAQRDLLAELLAWRTKLANRNSVTQGKITQAGQLARDLDSLFAAPPRTSASYAAAVPNVEARLELAIGDSDPSIESEQVRFPLVRDRYKALITPGVPATDQVLVAAGEVLDDVAGLISSLKANTEALIAARAQMKLVLAFLRQADHQVSNGTAFEKELSLLGYTQKTASTTVTCTNAFTKKVTLAQLPVTVLYKNDPALSISAGILLSTTKKQKLGTIPQKTGVDANGVPTFRNVFGVVDRARVQIAPFSFLNYRIFYFGKRSDSLAKPKYSFNLSAGIGVNPNSGTNEVEYFFGPAIGIKNYMIQFGDHIGRFQKGLNGGFALGDTVPASFPSVLPINKVYKHGFGIAISYRLPL